MNEKWDEVISSKQKLLNISLTELYAYRDLLYLIVHRDFISLYKQTILGPLWFFIQPIFTTIIFTFVFGSLANLGTNGIPAPLFYLSGIVIWNFFAESLLKTSETFIANQNLFGKVFFPRIIVPVSIVVSSLLKLGVQLILLVFFYLYYALFTEITVSPGLALVLVPVIIIFVSILGMSIGLIVSAMTTKYRDLRFLIQFGIQLAMYASPIVYPLSLLSGTNRVIIALNPISGFIETFRFGLFNSGVLHWGMLSYSAVISLLLFFLGVVVFTNVEKSFIDTI